MNQKEIDIKAYLARKRYYDLLIRAKHYGDISPEYLDEARERYRTFSNFEEYPFYELILEYEDTLLNAESEKLKEEVDKKSGRYYEIAMKRDQLYDEIIEKSKVIMFLYRYDKLRNVLKEGQLKDKIELDCKFCSLLNYINIYCKGNGQYIEPSNESTYMIEYSKPYIYLIPKTEYEDVKGILERIRELHRKIQLEIALRQIEPPDEARIQEYNRNQEEFLKLRNILMKYDLVHIMELIENS
jgi:hypothetical protein